MFYEDLVKTFKKKDIKGTYIFYGKEPFFINHLADLLVENALEESERAFSQNIFYGTEVKLNSVADLCITVPMAFGNAPRQLVVLRNPDLKKKGAEDLFRYMSSPVPSTILLITIETDQALPKGIPTKEATIFKSEPVKEKDMGKWIQTQFKNLDYTIQPDAVQTIIDYSGTNLEAITNEISKLKLRCSPDKPITRLDIQESFGIMRDFTIYNLQEAMGEKNPIKIFRIVDYFSRNPKVMPFEFLLASFYGFFKQLYQIKLAQRMEMTVDEIANAIGVRDSMKWLVNTNAKYASKYTIIQLENALIALAETDKRNKGIQGHSEDYTSMLKELVVKLIS